MSRWDVAASWIRVSVSYVQLWLELHHWEGLVDPVLPSPPRCAQRTVDAERVSALGLGQWAGTLPWHLFGERYLSACGISTQGAPLLTPDLSASCGGSILFSIKTANFFWTGVLARDFFHMPPWPPHPQCQVQGHCSINAF